MTFWQTFRSLFRRGHGSSALFWVVLIGGSVAAVTIGDLYGTFYWGIIGLVIIPFVATRLLLGNRRRKTKSR